MKQASDASPHPRGPLRFSVSGQAKGQVVMRPLPPPTGERSRGSCFLLEQRQFD